MNNHFEIEVPKVVYICKEPINMCKSFNGLAELVKDELHKKPENGDLFLFVNRAGNYIKVFFWSNGGWCILAKKLAGGKFDINGKKTIDAPQLQKLVDAVTIEQEDLLE